MKTSKFISKGGIALPNFFRPPLQSSPMILPTRNERRTLAARRPSFGTILRSPWSRRLRPPLTAVVSCRLSWSNRWPVRGKRDGVQSFERSVRHCRCERHGGSQVEPRWRRREGGSTTRGKTNDGEKEKNVVSHDRRYSTSRRYTDIDRYIARCEPLDRWLGNHV